MFKVVMAEGLQMILSRDGIATVRMNNGENRFRLSFAKAWMKILDDIERNPNIRGLIITGQGKIFSLGLDVEYFRTQTPEYVAATRRMNGQVYRRLMLLPVPTVAAVNGHAFGAGAILAMSCDYRVMRSDRGWICWPEVQLGMTIRQEILRYLRLKMPTGQAVRDAVLFGRRLTATEALTLQIVDMATSMDQLEVEAANYISSALGKHGLEREALGRVKEDVYGDREFSDVGAKL